MWYRILQCHVVPNVTPPSTQDHMVVSAIGLGVCRKSCGACKECPPPTASRGVGEAPEPGDNAAFECYQENRRKVGYLAYDASELQPLE